LPTVLTAAGELPAVALSDALASLKGGLTDEMRRHGSSTDDLTEQYALLLSL